MPKGVISFFNEQRGYGFIRADEAAKETEDAGVFFHYTAVEGGREVREGQPVSYDVKQGDRGLEATSVQTLV